MGREHLKVRGIAGGVTQGAHSSRRSAVTVHSRSTGSLSGKGEEEHHPVKVTCEDTGEGLATCSRGQIQV